MNDANRPQAQDGEPSEHKPGFLGIPGLVRDILSLNRAALAILITVPFVLTLLEYYGMPWHYSRNLERQSRLERGMSLEGTRNPPLADLLAVEMPGPPEVRSYLWWGTACLLLLVVIPALVAKLVAGLSLRDLGLRVKGTGRDAWTYLALYLIFMPVVYLVSLQPSFQAVYPFYKPRGGNIGVDFLIFEIVYCLQFFAIEFFFRGFMTLGLKRYIGWASVLVMIAPYCMIHYYKPMPEAMGAIGAGLILGALSWRTGTIIYGWALHYAVALSMDLLGLHHRGLI